MQKYKDRINGENAQRSAVETTRVHWYNEILSTFHIYFPSESTCQAHHRPPLVA